MVLHLAALTFGLLLSSSLTFANIVTEYTTQPAWQAGSVNLTNIDFNIAAGDYSTAAGLILNTVQFTGGHTSDSCYAGICWGGFVNDLQVRPSAAFGGSPALVGPQDGPSSNGFATTNSADGRLTVKLPPGVTSLGARFWFSNYAGLYSRHLYLYGVTGGLLDATIISNGFAGFTSQVPVAWLVLTSDDLTGPYPGTPTFYGYTDGGPILDNFGFGQIGGTATPEPSTGALMLLGAILLGALRLRQSRRSI